MYHRLFFFFQAEDGIRDGHVTGVQTCALPILNERLTPIVVNKTQVTIYLSNHEIEDEYRDTITSITKAIQSKIEKELNLSISVGISDIYTELSQSYQAFKESLEALR